MELAAHRHSSDTSLGRLATALAAVGILMAGEVVTGLLTHSLALVSDAGHLLTDLASLALAAYAVHRSRRPASSRNTFGHLRSGILVAAVNGIALLIVAGSLAAAAVARLTHPGVVTAAPVIVVAAIAMAVNVGLARMLSHAGTELGVRSAVLHLLADAVAAAGVFVSGVVIVTTGWQYADPLVSLVIAALIAAGALRLLGETRQILGEGTPWGIDAEGVRNAILGVRGVEGVHDLHIWSLDRSHRALSAHISVADRPLGEVTEVLHAVETRLCAEYGIEHATLQPECPACVVDPALFCDIDERHTLVHDRPPGVASTRG